MLNALGSGLLSLKITYKIKFLRKAFLVGFAAARSISEMKEWDKENGYKDICYWMTKVD